MNLKLVSYVGLVMGFILSLQPSYVHPDEHFQSVEILMKRIGGINGFFPWEFELNNAARSIVPLYIFYGPIIWICLNLNVRPLYVLYMLRLQNYVLFVITWKACIKVLAKSRLRREIADVFMSTSYVLGAFISHTLSNSFETIMLLTVLALLESVCKDSRKGIRGYFRFGLVGGLVALGIFNRITFLGFLFLPGIFTIWRYYSTHLGSAMITSVCFAIFSTGISWADSILYGSKGWIIAPLNNFLYNIKETNLALHGLHPRYTHVLVNIPQLIGPMFFLLGSIHSISHLPVLSCISGVTMLSILRHQEMRFILPVVPIFILSVDMSRIYRFVSFKRFFYVWLAFNLILAGILGVGHQRGVITSLNYLKDSPVEVQIWWKTYPPPTWMLMDKSLKVHTINHNSEKELYDVDFNIVEKHVLDLMGSDISVLRHALSMFSDKSKDINLILPNSVFKVANETLTIDGYNLIPIYKTYIHIGFDHIDFKDFTTLKPGIGVYEVKINKIE